ncbi:hypothetical protein [Sphingomonas sp. UNC305MFCol5.2]|uniref:hypothetical protein n=1 Tax=Sphingomonas sp. UNC305MFCol5.2 TaxID=1449076 RepID=UPI0004A71C65|nr:hypothetical protein [Sphingomonas sp. UNC305MFCol5.2]
MTIEAQVEEALHRARGARGEGEAAAALEFYMLASDLARTVCDEASLAHALRHVSDLAREFRLERLPLEAATEAVSIYETIGTSPLDRTNARRVQALALAQADGSAGSIWEEERRL